MDPVQPPLPSASNLLFHPDAGIQISTLISESELGFTVNATRQNAARSVYPAPCLPLPPPLPPPPPSGAYAPAATACAAVIVVSFRASELRLSHEAAADADAVNASAMIISAIKLPDFTHEVLSIVCAPLSLIN